MAVSDCKASIDDQTSISSAQHNQKFTNI